MATQNSDDQQTAAEETKVEGGATSHKPAGGRLGGLSRFGRGKSDGDGTTDKATKSTGTTKTTSTTKATSAATGVDAVKRARTLVAQVVWALFVVLALILALGALLIAIGANQDNDLVTFVLDRADDVDLGVFSRDNGIREFDGDNAETKNALFNWGIGAVAYLVVGRIVERVVRPGA